MLLYGIYQKSRGRLVYVGITTRSIVWRFSKHVGSSKSASPRQLMSRAIKKYGPADFVPVPLGQAETIEQLKELERQTIELLKTFVEHGGYNLTRGGDGVWGYKFDPVLAASLAEKRRGFKHTEEAKRRIIEAIQSRPGGMLGKHHTDETRQRISLSLSGENHPNFGTTRPGVGEKVAAKLRGRVVPEEQRAAISAGLKGKPKTAEHNRKVGDALRGKPKSDEHRRKLKEAWERRRARSVEVNE